MPYVIRKLRNQNLYSVKNQITGHVHAYGTTLARAKAQVRLLESKGEGLHTQTVKQLVDNSYSYPKEDIGNLVFDKELSTRKAQVYHDPTTGQTIVANRGTTGTLADWTNNLAYMTGLYGKTGRWKQAKKVQKKAISKYGHVDVNVGHSQGGILAHKLNKRGLTNEVINVNPASRGHHTLKNETVLRSKHDLVSQMQRGKHVHHYKSSKDPLKSHSTSFLKGNAYVGKGVDNETTGEELADYMKHFKIKNFHGSYVKDQLPELNDGFYIINLNGHSHWTGLLKDHDNFYYFDPFGFPAPTEVEDEMNKFEHRYFFNEDQIQDIDTTSCGFYVVAWIRHMYKKGDKQKLFLSFLEKFRDPKHNDRILKTLL